MFCCIKNSVQIHSDNYVRVVNSCYKMLENMLHTVLVDVAARTSNQPFGKLYTRVVLLHLGPTTLFEAILKLSFWNSFQSCRRISIAVLNINKMCFFQNFFNLMAKKEVIGGGGGVRLEELSLLAVRCAQVMHELWVHEKFRSFASRVTLSTVCPGGIHS